MVKFIFKGAQTVTVLAQELWMEWFLLKMLFEIFYELLERKKEYSIFAYKCTLVFIYFNEKMSSLSYYVFGNDFK